MTNKNGQTWAVFSRLRRAGQPLRGLSVRAVLGLVRKLVVGVLGTVIAVTGLITGPFIIGPTGAIMIIVGVGMLATEFLWARRLARRGQAAVHLWAPRLVGRRGKTLWRWKKRISAWWAESASRRSRPRRSPRPSQAVNG